MTEMIEWGIGLVCAVVVSIAAYWKRSLSFSGMLAATVMGTIYFAVGDLFWFGLLLLFFVSSSLISRLNADQKIEIEKGYAKSGTRDAAQVLANGGLGMLACIGNAVWPNPLWSLFFVGSMASVTADTWATECGSLSSSPPRSIVSGKRLAPGTSGGVSWLGSSAAMGGALTIGAAGWLLYQWSSGYSEPLSDASLWSWLVLGGLSGFAGAMLDSLIGATCQKMYRCSVCGQSVEVEEHCSSPTMKLRGLRWMNNDMVNGISSWAAGIVAVILGAWLL